MFDALHLKQTFWSFSVRLYSKPAVEEAILQLQKKYHLNINIIFFCCWIADQSFAALKEEQIENILRKITPWHEKIVLPMKKLRKTMAKYQVDRQTANLYQAALRNELLTEQIEQAIILQSVGNLEKGKNKDNNATNSAVTNIFNYIHYQNIKLHKNDLEKLYRIVKLCFPEEEIRNES